MEALNGLSTVVAALLHTPRPRPPAVAGKGKTAALRNMLRCGPASCSDLAERSGLTRKLVSDLLYSDIRRARVRKDGAFYSLAPEFDEEEAQRIRSAIALLRAHGYSVVKEGR